MMTSLFGPSGSETNTKVSHRNKTCPEIHTRSESQTRSKNGLWGATLHFPSELAHGQTCITLPAQQKCASEDSNRMIGLPRMVDQATAGQYRKHAEPNEIDIQVETYRKHQVHDIKTKDSTNRRKRSQYRHSGPGITQTKSNIKLRYSYLKLLKEHEVLLSNTSATLK